LTPGLKDLHYKEAISFPRISMVTTVEVGLRKIFENYGIIVDSHMLGRTVLDIAMRLPISTGGQDAMQVN